MTDPPETEKPQTTALLEGPAAKLVAAGCVSAVAVGAAALFLFDPSTSSFYPPCIFHEATGLWCPGCGSTRAAYALVHGDLASAFGFNPLMVLALPYLGYCAASYAVPVFTTRSLPDLFGSPRFAWMALWIVLIFWLLRNIPVYPFSLLAP